jgi:hypothetical protein
MMWRLARALEQLRAQVNAQWPQRSKQSDGSIGDAAHSSRASDHNPDGSGVVRAIDITHDPKSGFDSYAFADLLLKRQDRRLKYIISNGRIGSGPAGPQPGVWRKYTGANRHDHHVHISTVAGASGDDPKPWDIGGVADAAPEVVQAYVPPRPTLRKGAKGGDVQTLQGRLNANGANLRVDGDFGLLTERAVRLFQTERKLVVDGVVGPQTWAALY